MICVLWNKALLEIIEYNLSMKPIVFIFFGTEKTIWKKITYLSKKSFSPSIYIYIYIYINHGLHLKTVVLIILILLQSNKTDVRKRNKIFI